ncbi:MAG: AAA family ATPase [Syntrophomonadaceae bacterium]|nr:AAA family ATPase [Syntrophomonadaceae bacterium]
MDNTKVYIKKLRLRNFQSHRETDFEFDPGLNIIVGPSDQGKSAIIRAMRWLIYNEPRGSGFIRSGETRCQVRMEMSNGVVVERIRDDSARINRYHLEIEGQEPLVFERFNKEVPLEVRQALGMEKLVIDRDRSVEINLAGQLEAPFLLEESGGTRSKILGRMANLHIIDAAQREALRDVSQASQEINRLNEDIAALDEQLAEYDDLEDQIIRLQQLESLLVTLKAREEELHTLEALLARLKQTDQELAEVETTMDRLEKVDEVVAGYQQVIRQQLKELQYLQELGLERKDNMQKIAVCNKIIDNTTGIGAVADYLSEVRDLRQEGFELQTNLRLIKGMEQERKSKQKDWSESIAVLQALEALGKAEEMLEKTNNLKERQTIYTSAFQSRQSLTRDLEAAQVRLGEKRARVDEAARQFGDALQQAGRCPTCFTEIDRDIVERIRREAF